MLSLSVGLDALAWIRFLACIWCWISLFSALAWLPWLAFGADMFVCSSTLIGFALNTYHSRIPSVITSFRWLVALAHGAGEYTCFMAACTCLRGCWLVFVSGRSGSFCWFACQSTNPMDPANQPNKQATTRSLVWLGSLDGK